MRGVPLLSLVVLLLVACAETPPKSIIQLPMTARPAQAMTDPEPSGGIYQTRPGYGFKPIFEDRRARVVGDNIVVSIAESTTASKKSSADAARTTSSSITSTANALPVLGVLNRSLTGSDTTKFGGSGDAAATNAFTGTITVTVIEVLPNGNLLVSGEKQIAVNKGTEFVRLSGVVNPDYILTGNTISSTQIADAKLEYRANGFIDETQNMGWMQRALMTISPF